MKAKLIKLLGGYTQDEVTKKTAIAQELGFNAGIADIKNKVKSIIANVHPNDWRKDVYDFITK